MEGTLLEALQSSGRDETAAETWTELLPAAEMGRKEYKTQKGCPQDREMD